jgi:hypothetical protein
MVPFIAISPYFVFGVDFPKENHITADARAERKIKESRSETV